MIISEKRSTKLSQDETAIETILNFNDEGMTDSDWRRLALNAAVVAVQAKARSIAKGGKRVDANPAKAKAMLSSGAEIKLIDLARTSRARTGEAATQRKVATARKTMAALSVNDFIAAMRGILNDDDLLRQAVSKRFGPDVARAVKI